MGGGLPGPEGLPCATGALPDHEGVEVDTAGVSTTALLQGTVTERCPGQRPGPPCRLSTAPLH